jgi:tight adherence protein B
MKKKKEKYIPIKGLAGEAKDYRIYNMNFTERLVIFLIGFGLAGVATYIFFEILLLSLIAGILTGIKIQSAGNKFLKNKREKALLLQFRDFLDSLNSSFSAGKNPNDAIKDAYADMQMQYGENALLTKEIYIISKGIDNGFNLEELFNNFGDRSNIEDIKNFSDTFSVCYRMGGNLKRVISETQSIINDKILIEMEIETIINSSKNNMNIMMVIPFVIMPMMKSFGNAGDGTNGAMDMAIKFIVLAIFITAYLIGKKITDIKI